MIARVEDAASSTLQTRLWKSTISIGRYPQVALLALLMGTTAGFAATVRVTAPGLTVSSWKDRQAVHFRESENYSNPPCPYRY
jgi:hypothetical protein